MPHHSLSLYVIKPYWSKQHGAYLTLITCWGIAVLLSSPSPPALFLQSAVLLLLVSGLNLGELLIEKLRRKTPLPKQKQVWLLVYSLLTVVSGIVVYTGSSSFRFLLLLLTAGGIIFIALSVKRMQKSIVAEWTTFALFSLAGLLAYKPLAPPDLKSLQELGLLMSIYFGISVFTVKARLNKISPVDPLIYALAASVLLMIVYGATPLNAGISLLLLLKALTVAVTSAWYRKLKIKQVGMMEMGYHLLFVLILFVLYS